MFWGEKRKEKGKKVDIYIDGQPSSQKKVDQLCSVCEGYSYMADYVIDENGYLKEIRYDRIKEQ